MHRQTYACLSRKELVGFDKGLYQALWKARQIDQAIPEDNRFILSGERESIVEKLKANGGNVPLTAKQLGKSVSTVRYIAKERKLYVPQTLSHTLEERTRIVQSYERFNGNANEASRQLHVSSKNIRQYWREVGLKIIRNPINKLSDEEIQKIIQSHTIYGCKTFALF